MSASSSSVELPDAAPAARLRWLGRVDYQQTWARMMAFTEQRASDAADEIWFLEHAPVFTLGLNGKREHVLAPGDIPVVQTDRGGQVTYHGPGQLVVYPLLDIRRLRLGARQLVQALEQGVLNLLAARHVQAHARRDAPGVYVGNCKLASIGLRIKRGCSYHGLAVNAAMDCAPFRLINPCGFAGLEVTDLAALGVHCEPHELAAALAPFLLEVLRLPAASEWV